MELASDSVRVGLIEPGSVNTEIQNQIRPEIRAIPRPEFSGYDKLESLDIAEAIAFMVTRERRAAVSEMLVRPSAQVT
jgi:NADP-dependent 3-hydroxy acid dehydrogenase YdfG